MSAQPAEEEATEESTGTHPSDISCNRYLGLILNPDSTAVVRIWAPHASKLVIEIGRKSSDNNTNNSNIPCQEPPAASDTNNTTTTNNNNDNNNKPASVVDPYVIDKEFELFRLPDSGNIFECRLPALAIRKGDPYRLRLDYDSRTFYRRDPHARAAHYESTWCFADDGGAAYVWKSAQHKPRPFDEYIIYEMHIGSFTKEGTLKAAIGKLKHVADVGFTAVEVMPLAEFSYATEKWGYNPRLLMSLHGPYGRPDDLREFVDEAHALGLNVIVDVVLHHGAVSGNELWDFDGWGGNYFGEGGIYHENGHNGPWGKAFAFWKGEVRDMIKEACAMWLTEYRCDGLRFDSANDLPWEFIPEWTHYLHQIKNGCFLIAEITPENPEGISRLGFDSLWTHSGYFDIIQQHRALGRGHHGGGDWAEGWNLPRLRTAMCLHYGFNWPTQCIKYMTGSHDQCGCQHNGAHYDDLKMIGGQKRYFTDQCGGGRNDFTAVSAQRLWYTANVAAAGIPMVFMGTEFAHHGWWNPDEYHGINWDLAEDEKGSQMIACFTALHALRNSFEALRVGWPKVLHEDRPNGVLVFERVKDGAPRIVVVINAGRNFWQNHEYGAWVGHGENRFEEIFCSQHNDYSGTTEWKSNRDSLYDPQAKEPVAISSYDGKLWLNIPPTCAMMFQQLY